MYRIGYNLNRGGGLLMITKWWYEKMFCTCLKIGSIRSRIEPCGTPQVTK